MQTRKIAGPRLSSASKGLLAVAGHAGAGHVYSHSGYVQEDSGGFAILAALFAHALGLDVSMASIKLDRNGTVLTVRTTNGGTGTAVFDEGFTPWEGELLQRLPGMRSFAPQTLAQRVLGRISGQGSNQAATVLCEAIAKSLMDSFKIVAPDNFIYESDDQPGTSGGFLGAVLDFDGVPTACLLTLNASRNGVGPNEDAEGNVPIGAKGRIMERMGMLDAPCIVLEGKSFVPEISSELNEIRYFIRWNRAYDNPIVADCLHRATLELGYPAWVSDQAYPRGDHLSNFTKKVGKKIEVLGRDFANARSATEKIRLAALLADTVRTDLGGAIFMSDALNRVVGSGGLWPGSAAVLGLVVPPAYIKRWKIPALTDEDVEGGAAIVSRAVSLLRENLSEAQTLLAKRRPDLDRRGWRE